ncbi:hypothetical protein [Alkalibacillus aidingensis]|uniref:hypothetical protein n=1 Tax=Alkalibacillus aidingensis TaxID=2747607 RepID=UPI0016617DA3|nr:hypothetical protein [Alkalibacillus aidingensis]
MNICPKCKSDSLEKGYSMGLRVLVCLLLAIVVPFGILFCWIPFVFPYKYHCDVCGSDVDRDDVVQMDWREREELIKEHQQFEEKIAPFLGKWIEGDDGKIFKVAKGKGLLLLVEPFSEDEQETYRIVNYHDRGGEPTIAVSPKVGKKYLHVTDVVGSFANGDPMETALTTIGRDLITEEEFDLIKDSESDFYEVMKEQGKVEQDINIEMVTESDDEKVEW